ncbi:MAG: hypothetical protein HUJ58_10225 [Erysipelotrichaceae bacterium]|nr:hypothetical protein [Erysipelotrichaceae bacterium]
MKRMVLLLLCIFLLLPLASCEKKNEIEEKDRLVAINATTFLKARNDESFFVLLDIELKEKMGIEELTKQLDAIKNMYGKIQSIDSEATVGYIEAGNKVVEVPVLTDVGWMNVEYTINATSSIVDFKIIPSDKLDEDGYNETLYELTVEDMKTEMIVTRPTAFDENTPVLILIGGRHAYDWNSTIGVNKVFRDLSYLLADEGVAVVRYDRLLDSEDVDDSLQLMTEELNQIWEKLDSFDDLRTHPRYMLGYDQGGFFMPLLAQMFEADGYIISSAMSGYLQDDLAEETLRNIESGNKSEQEKETARSQVQAALDMIDSLEKEEDYAYNILGYPTSFWLTMREYDSAERLETISGRVLITQGSNDFEVDETDYSRWKKAGKNLSNVTYKYYKNMNHIFAINKEPSTEEDYLQTMKIYDGFVKDLVQFMKKQEI